MPKQGTNKTQRLSDEEVAKSDRDWWQSVAPPGWVLRGWTDREEASFVRNDSIKAHMTMDGVAGRHIQSLLEKISKITVENSALLEAAGSQEQSEQANVIRCLKDLSMSEGLKVTRVDVEAVTRAIEMLDLQRAELTHLRPRRVLPSTATDVVVPHEFARKALLGLMSGISEDCWCAGWMSGNEKRLWEISQAGGGQYGQGEVTSAQAEKMTFLANTLQEWFVWDEASGEVIPIALSDWEARMAAFSESKNEGNMQL
jgi:hypothetical protein